MGARLVWTGAFALLAILLAGCRLDMHDQPKFKPLRENDFYSDLRSSRPIIGGTVARGQLNQDTYLHTGLVNGKEGDLMPFPATREVLERGRDRYNIYCSPCHSQLGDGNGMIVQRGFKRPPSYHIDRLRKAPIGHFFNVMTNGYGAMARLLCAGSGQRPLGHRSLHTGVAVEPERDAKRRVRPAPP